tara:strand:+ start:349475 stop:350083 length:609 start_codon:yes stop_codon:yes gene_type:complete
LKFKKKKPKQERSQLMVESIVEAAARILNEEKKENFTTNNIAEVAGVSIGSLYQYYKNKESILEDLLLKNVIKNIEMLLDEKVIDNEVDTKTFIRTIVTAQYDAWNERSILSKKLMQVAPKILDPSFILKNDEKLIMHFKDLIEKYAVKDIKSDNLDISLLLVINAVRMGIYQSFLHPDKYDSKIVLEEMIELITGYLVEPV